MRKRLVAVLLLLVFMVSLAAAPWDLNQVSEPVSHDTLSNRSLTKQVVELVDENGASVTESELEDQGYDFNFVYNSSSGSSSIEGDMKHLADGYYYASFKPNFTDGMVEYELEDPDPEINLTENVPIGNNTVEIQNDLSQEFKAGEEVSFEVEVTDEWNDQNEDSATVHLYFTNGTWTSSMVELGYNSQDELYTNSLSVPEKPNSTYLVHANSTTSGVSYSNPEGSNSLTLNTLPSISGEINTLETGTGCNNQSFFDACERGANITTEFEVTTSSADSVELQLLGINSTDDWVELSSDSMTQDGNNWTGEVEVPDLNTTEYDDELILRYNATKDEREFTLTRNFSYRSYKVMDRSSALAYQGSSYQVELLFAKHFSLEPLDSSRFDNASIDVDNADGDNLTEFDLSDMSYDDSEGLFRHTVDIPSDAPAGGYDLGVTAYNIYGDKKTLDSGFNVQDIDATFNTTGDISMDINKTGIHETNVTVMSKVSSEKVLTVTVDGDTENFTTVNNGDNITVPGDGEVEFPVEFNVTRVEDYVGDITFSDSSSEFNETIDVDLQAPYCELRDGVLCLQNFDEDDMEVERDERGTTYRVFDLLFLGEKDGETDVTVWVDGNISSYLDIDPASFTINGTQELNASFTANAPGTFMGNVSIEGGGDDVNFTAELESDVEATEASISVPSTLELGYLPSGETVTRDITVENTGRVAVNGVTASSTAYSVSSDSGSLFIGVGGSETVELTFDSVTSESGTVTLEAETDTEAASANIDVTATTVPDYSEQAETLSDRISSLSSQAEDEQVVNRLQNLEADVSQIKTDYQQGDYQQAEETYQSVSSTLDSISQQIGGTDRQQPEQQGGGFPILVVALVLFVLLAIGFVAYTSIIPEEGDPLYGVLDR